MKPLMKLSILTTMLTLPAFPGPLAQPIPVIGGGMFEYDHTAGGAQDYSIWFSGYSNDGTRYVFVSATCAGGFPLCGSQMHANLPVNIDGMLFPSGFFGFSLGNGTITGFDSQYRLMITETISGWVTQTSLNCPNGPLACNGSFSIGPTGGLMTDLPERSSPVPDPASWVTGLIGCAAILAWRRRGSVVSRGGSEAGGMT